MVATFGAMPYLFENWDAGADKQVYKKFDKKAPNAKTRRADEKTFCTDVG